MKNSVKQNLIKIRELVADSDKWNEYTPSFFVRGAIASVCDANSIEYEQCLNAIKKAIGTVILNSDRFSPNPFLYYQSDFVAAIDMAINLA